MDINRKQTLLALLGEILNRKKTHVDSTKEAARNYAEQAIESSSINAFRPNAEAAVDFAKQLLMDAEALHQELTKSSNSTPDQILAPCYVMIQYEKPTNKTIEVYFVGTNLKLPSLFLVTPKSPLGQAIVGKGVGDKILFSIGGEESSGVILKIE